MTVLGIILIAIGVILFFVRKSKRAKAFNIKSARPASAAELQETAAHIAKEIGSGSWRDYVKMRGRVQVKEPLESELGQQACVHYAMTVTREYEETVTEARGGKATTKTRRGSETVASNKRSTPFFVVDSSGQVLVNPDGASIETVKVLDEFRPGASSGGTLSFGRFSLAMSGGTPEGRRRTLGYRYTESILPVDESVLVVGNVSDSTGEVTLCHPTEGDREFIISLKTDEQLTAAAARGARSARYGMIACWGIGLILLVVGLLG